MSSLTNGNLLVMSYNISFEAMTNNSRGSAGALGAKCIPVEKGSKLTICARNMANFIDKIPESIQFDNFDFVGMQEASRWSEMQGASSLLSNLSAHGSKFGRSEMVSFYNSNKYTLSKHTDSGFEHDRPFQILVFSKNESNDGIIFINAHCPHHLPKSHDQYTYEEFRKHITGGVQRLALSEDEKKYRIISVGDFNETQWLNNQLQPNQFNPIDSDIISTTIGIKNTPFTCCQGSGNWANAEGNRINGWRAGDYIFDSKELADTQVPSIYPATKLLSDHLPVIAILPS